MQSERWQSCTDIFHAALERPPNERSAFVEQRCAGDDTLRRKVETLLRYHEEAGEFIGSPAFERAPELLAEDPDALIGEQIGQYRIDAVLGVGGMGVVYLAHDERLGRKVGLKLLPRSLVSDEAQLARLKLEARTVSALNHPNIVTVHEIGQADSTHYIAIEFIEGVTLRERLTRGPIPADKAIDIMSQVASALSVAHRAGIVHRDIKPENIMIRPDGYVKVLDFGIAKSVQSNRTERAMTSDLWQASAKTSAGVVLGTMRYMSPEQTRGSTLDARSDIWSLGVVLYEILAARAPFDGDDASAIRAAVLGLEPPAFDEVAVPLPLRKIVARCLRKNAAERYQSCEALLAALRAAKRRGDAVRSPGWRIAAIAAAAVAIAAALFVGLRRETASPNESAHKSIAVLPFTDLSPERDQQYFSDGMSEEILNALSHVKDLKVAGRSSAFAFRGRYQDVRSIGSALGVAHVVEGSVRKQGDKVRISAQLVQVSDGFEIWSESYDGEVRDIFSLQERIARAITDQLQIVLEGEQKSQLVKVATTNSEAYALFLQATAIFNRRDSTRFIDAVAQLREAVRLDPKFARAHARLASLSSIAPAYDVDLDQDEGTVVRTAHRAIELDPTLAEPHAAIGQLLFTQRRFTNAHVAYKQALAIDDNDTAANFWLATLLSSAGQPEASAALLDKILASDPMLPSALLWRGWVHLQLGNIDDAERAIQRAADAGLTSVGLALAHVARARGDNPALVDWLTRGLDPFMRDLPAGTSAIIAAGTVGGEAERTQALRVIQDYLATERTVISGAIPLALIWLGEPDRALQAAQEKSTRNDTVFLPSLWIAFGRNARTSPSFPTFSRQSGLAEFWAKTSPPAHCRKNDRGDYVCE